MLNVNRLRILIEVSNRGSFSAAADALSYTQSAVSQQVAALEAETPAQNIQVCKVPNGGRRAVLKGIFVMSAAQEPRSRLKMQPTGLNIYSRSRPCRRSPSDLSIVLAGIRSLNRRG